MQNPEDANAELAEMLTDIIQECVALGLSRRDATLLCLGCNLDSKDVLGPQLQDKLSEGHPRYDFKFPKEPDPNF
jgi:hypothetical protein